MVTWFLEKDVSLFSRHRDAPLTALHLYVHRLSCPGAFFNHDAHEISTNEYHMGRIQEMTGIPYDDCTCPCSRTGCSPTGCSPIKLLCARPFKPKSTLRQWLKKVKPPQKFLQQYAQNFTRLLLFSFLDGEHTYCNLGGECYLKTFPPVTRAFYWERMDFRTVSSMRPGQSMNIFA
jgi:hypothetical protein